MALNLGWTTNAPPRGSRDLAVWKRPTLPQDAHSPLFRWGLILLTAGVVLVISGYSIGLSNFGRTLQDPNVHETIDGIRSIRNASLAVAIGYVSGILGLILTPTGLVLNEIRQMAYEAHLRSIENPSETDRR